MILFTADWHIKLGQKNVPISWACSRYKLFFQQVQEAIDKHDVSLHIIGGDLFDRVPSMDDVLPRPTADAQLELLRRVNNQGDEPSQEVSEEFDVS